MSNNNNPTRTVTDQVNDIKANFAKRIETAFNNAVEKIRKETTDETNAAVAAFADDLMNVLRHASIGSLLETTAAIVASTPAAPQKTTNGTASKTAPAKASTDEEVVNVAQRVLNALNARGAVNAKTGVDKRTIAEDTGIAPELLAKPFAHLRATNAVKSTGSRRAMVYYATGK